MKLITETYMDGVDYEAVLNEETKSKKYYIKGIFAEQEQKNRNGRIYPKMILEREVNSYQEKISNKSAIGELNHPDYPLPDPKQACHRVVEMNLQGNDWYGKSLILEGTQWGDHLIAMLKNDCRLGISTRGVGSVKMNEGVAIVQDDFRLNCLDIVLNPSANKAFVNGIMEGVEWVWNHGVLVESECADIKSEIEKGSKITESELSSLTQKWFNGVKSKYANNNNSYSFN